MIKKLSLFNFSFFGAAALLLTSSAARAGTNYSFETLNNNGDLNFNQLLGINDSGYIAGYFGDGTVVPNNGYVLAPPYGQANYTPENFPGSAQTQVVGIDNIKTNGTYNTVGFYVDNAGGNHGFRDFGGTFTTVDNSLTGSAMFNQVLGLNDKNIGAGFYNDSVGNAHPYLVNLTGNVTQSSFSAINLPSFFNAVSAMATDVNNSGVVSGTYTDTGGVVHGFLEIGGKFTSLDDPHGNGTNTSFFGLNNNGDVVGSFVNGNGTNGLLYNWYTHTWQTIDDPNASFTSAFGVNGTTINGINDLDQMVGFYSDGTHVDGMLVNTPEPGPLALMSLGAIALGFIRRRQRKS